MQLESNFDVDNYNKSRGDLKKGFTEFFNLMKTHIKKSFKIIFEEKLDNYFARTRVLEEACDFFRAVE